MIVFRGVSHSYRTIAGSVVALDGVDLSFAPGELTCLVGPNGSGKSTLALLCNGLLVPTAGQVTVDGLDTGDEENVWEVRSRVGLVFQDPDDQIIGTSVEEDAAFAPENLGVAPEEIAQRVREALEAVGLTGLERREPHHLSEGQKQRLAIAGLLAMRPRYLVLDEPTSMLDAAGRRSVLDILHRLSRVSGTGVVLITHRMEELALADRCVVLDSGRVAYDGPPEGVLGDRNLIERCALAVPPVWRLAQTLRDSGVPVPVTAVDPVSLAGSLGC